MKNLELNQMEELQGGLSRDCGAAAGAWIVTGTNPVGWGVWASVIVAGA